MKKVILKNTSVKTLNLDDEFFEYLKNGETFLDTLLLIIEEEIVKDRIKQNYPGYKIDSTSWETDQEDGFENNCEVYLVKE